MSKQKIEHLKKLELEYEAALERVEENEGKRLQDYRNKIVEEGCWHPNEFLIVSIEGIVNPTSTLFTNEQYSRTKLCSICGKVIE